MTPRSLGRLVSAALVLALLAACTGSSDNPLPTLGEPIPELVEGPTESVLHETVEAAPIATTEPTSASEQSGAGNQPQIKPPGNEPTVLSEPALPPGEANERLAEVTAPDPGVVEGPSSEGTDQVESTLIEVQPVSGPDRVASYPGPPVGGSTVPANIRISSSYRPDTNVRVDGEVIQAVVFGTVNDRSQVYALAGGVDQKLEAVLLAPPGVTLEVRHGDEVLRADQGVSQRLETTLTRDGELFVSVIPSGEQSADFELLLRIGFPDPEPVPPPPPPVTRQVPSRPRIGPGDVVYLTFDDGPNPRHTPEVLDLLARYGARATFFVVGSLVEKYPDIFQRIVTEGHTVANHTWRHENLAGLNKAEFDETISRTEEILGEHATPCLRPPYAATGSRTREWSAEYGLELHLWTVSANDWLGLTGEEIADRIVSQVTYGSVVLMHDGGGNRTQTVRGLSMLLDRLADLDLRYEPLCR